ncbi:MAG TPA: SpoIIE family protein phosphatase [Terriglobia bacterium]|nr:SpoIIE family protein phosphatase [Terriglobia bacterium]
MAKIMVVEDEPGIALGLEDSLRLEGYQVEVITNGTKASCRALEEPFDLILLDVMLPGKDGFEVCRDLRKSGLEAPIILLTAKTQEADRVAGFEMGANDYVTKPFSPRELMARVRRLLQFVESNRQDRRRLEEEVEAALEVQQRLFPSSPPVVPGLDYAGLCRPARGVSGDYYDFLMLPSGCLAMLLADVSGKGMPAALLAASLHAAVRAYAPAADRNAGEVLANVNRLLFDTTSTDRFATVFYGVYDPADRTLTWANAGHCSPLWFQPSSKCTPLDTLTMPAGILPAIPALQRTMQLNPGDQLLIISDGITEACNDRDEEFGETRLTRLVHDSRGLPASGLCRAILEEVREFTRGCPQADDLTVVALNLQPLEA